MSQLVYKIQNLWSKEWLLKLISLCIAAMLWYYVGGEDVVEKNVMVPVEIINLPNDLIISNKHKKEIEATVRGPRSLLLEMGKNQEAFQIDLSKATPGTRVEQIDNDSIPVGRGLEVLRVQPSSIILSLDKLIKKEFSINPVTTGNVSPGFILKSLKLDPDSISITGPQTILSQVDVLKTTPINISGLSESIQLQIPLELNEALVDLIGETSVTADLTIVYDTVEKEIQDVPVNVAVEGFLKEVKPAKVTVRLKVPKVILKDDIQLRELISATAVKAEGETNRNRLKVQVIPSGDLTVPLEIVSIEPEYVTRVEDKKAPAGNTTPPDGDQSQTVTPAKKQSSKEQ